MKSLSSPTGLLLAVIVTAVSLAGVAIYRRGHAYWRRWLTGIAVVAVAGLISAVVVIVDGFAAGSAPAMLVAPVTASMLYVLARWWPTHPRASSLAAASRIIADDLRAHPPELEPDSYPIDSHAVVDIIRAARVALVAVGEGSPAAEIAPAFVGYVSPNSATDIGAAVLDLNDTADPIRASVTIIESYDPSALAYLDGLGLDPEICFPPSIDNVALPAGSRVSDQLRADIRRCALIVVTFHVHTANSAFLAWGHLARALRRGRRR